jgi:hypothetical protein
MIAEDVPGTRYTARTRRSEQSVTHRQNGPCRDVLIGVDVHQWTVVGVVAAESRVDVSVWVIDIATAQVAQTAKAVLETQGDRMPAVLLQDGHIDDIAGVVQDIGQPTAGCHAGGVCPKLWA